MFLLLISTAARRALGPFVALGALVVVTFVDLLALGDEIGMDNVVLLQYPRSYDRQKPNELNAKASNVNDGITMTMLSFFTILIGVLVSTLSIRKIKKHKQVLTHEYKYDIVSQVM